MKTERRLQSGATLIEVLVSILVFSFGILGLVALHARATQFSVDAEDRTRAALLANELATTMWTAGTVNLSAADIAAWETRVAAVQESGLPNGEGEVTVDGNVANIVISWRHPTRAQGADGAEARFTTQVVIP